MRNWLFLSVIIACGILQATLLDAFRVFNIKPDLLLLSVVIASLSFSARWALALSLCAGIFKDVLSASGILNSFLFPVWSLLIIKLSRNITLEDRFARVFLLFIVALAHNIVSGLVFVCAGKIIPLGLFLRLTLLGSCYTALILPLALVIIEPGFFQDPA